MLAQTERSVNYHPGFRPGRTLLRPGRAGRTGPFLRHGLHDRAFSPAAGLAELREWMEKWFPQTTLVAQWAAQDYVTADRVPWAGPVLPGQDEVLVAGGHGKRG
jgi:glycine/D-amino acid oxidase-like deaminating enzyme